MHTFMGNIQHIDKFLVSELHAIDLKSSMFQSAKTSLQTLATHRNDLKNKIDICRKSSKQKRIRWLALEKRDVSNREDKIFFDELLIELWHDDKEYKALEMYIDYANLGLDAVQKYLDGKA